MSSHRYFTGGSGGVLLLWLLWTAPAAPQAPQEPAQRPLRPEAAPRVLSVTIEGNEVVSSRRLRSAIGTGTGSTLDPERLRADRESIQGEYAEEGFPLAHVEALLEPLPRGRVDVTLRIDEGPRARLQEVDVVGNDSFSEREIISASGLQPVRGFGFLARGDYRPGSVWTAVSRLLRFYRSRGFFDVEIQLEDFRLGKRQSRIYIELRIEEGTRRRVVGYDVRGQKLFPRELLLEELDLEAPDEYRGEKVEAAARRLILAYQRRSDVAASVRIVHLWRGDEGVQVVFEIKERPHRFVGKVDILGNWKTRDRVIRRRLRVIPGDVLMPRDLEESQRRLEESGLFSDVLIRALETGEPNVFDLEVEVEETEYRGFFALGGGASSGAGEVAYVQIQSLNFDLFRLPRSLTDWRGAFAGGDQKLEVEIIPGNRESYYYARFVEPYFFSTKNALSFRGGSQIIQRATYDETRLGFEADVRRFLDEGHRLSVALAYRLENVLIDGLQATAPPDVQSDRGYTLLAYPRASIRYEDLELNLHSGPVGISAEASVDFADSATGSEVDFVRVAGRAEWYQPFFDRLEDYRHLLRVGVEGGWVEGRGEPLPFFERFFLGGPRSFRGFAYRGLGPRQLTTPVGGRGLLHGTVEYSLPLLYRELRLVALFDWGTLESRPGSFSIDRFRTAAGGGLQLRLPFPLTERVFPVNLYWVQALSSEAGDEEQLFGFTLGFGF